MDPHQALNSRILHGSQCGGLNTTGQFITADFNQRIGVVECEAEGLDSVNIDSWQEVGSKDESDNSTEGV
jgi:hypothetical protein